MNLNIGIEQNLGLSQQLNMAPQLLQWLKILQASTTTLSELVQHELETNPTLEIDTLNPPQEIISEEACDENIAESISDATPQDSSDAEYSQEERYRELQRLEQEWPDDYGTGNEQSSGNTNDAQERHQYTMDSISSTESIHQHLMHQLALVSVSEQDMQIAEFIIGSIDERGYFSITIEEICASLNVPVEDVERVLSLIQEMHPVGVGARNLRECLLLQIDDRMETAPLARTIINHHLDALANEQYMAIAQTLETTEESVISAAQIISSLNPAPGKAFESNNVNTYITPDITIYKKEGSYIIELNDKNIPHLRLSSSCRQLINQKDLSSSDTAYIRSKIRSAVFIMQGITQRQETLRKVTEQIIKFQMEYLDSEEGEMKPLTMAKIAAIIGVHETTVSRALANKYIKTPRGVFCMKHFFKSGYQCMDGSALTPESVKSIIATIIGGENSGKPLKDLDIMDMLKEKGVRIARRTIAKYREELNIPSSKVRCRKNKTSRTRNVVKMPATEIFSAVA